MSTIRKRTLNTREITTIACLAAVASILFMLEIPVVLFYKLDFSNLPPLLAMFSMGPLAGTLTLAIKSLVGLLHSSSQGVGELADFLMGLAMILPAGILYQRSKTRRGALTGMVVGGLCATLVGVLSNLYILIPFYALVYGMPVEQIIAMGQAIIPSIHSAWEFVLLITAPFNLLKWTAICVVGWVLYKPLSPLLHGRRRSENR